MIKEVDKMTDRIEPIHPGEILQEDFLTPMNISAYKLAKETFIDQTRISEIIRGKRSITVDTALRFSKFFGTSPEFWINIQIQFDMEKKKEELAPELIKIHTFEFDNSKVLQIV
jgi:addiction module HigA family antidote